MPPTASPCCLSDSTLNKRLWIGGGALALFLAIIFTGNFLIDPDRAVGRRMLGHDFLSFYAAGHFARTGQSERLYDQKAIHEFQARIIKDNNLDCADVRMPFWNPPFVAWMFAPLSLLPYQRALEAWWALMLACFVASLWLMARMLPRDAGWRAWGLIPLLLVASGPFQQAATHGQNTSLSLLLLCLVVTFWRRGQALAAGLVGGLLMYKPQLGLPVLLVLMLSEGRRAVLGFVCTTTALALLAVLSMPGATSAFLVEMPRNMRSFQQSAAYMWERHVTLRAFWRLLIGGHAAGPIPRTAAVLWGLSELALVCLLASAVLRHMRLGRSLATCLGRSVGAAFRRRDNDRLISAAILCMPLLMPYFFDYDLLVLAVPAVLLGAELVGSPEAQRDRWLVRAWVCLYLWMLVGPGAARWLHVNLTSPLLAIVAVMHIARTWRRTAPAAEMRIHAAGPTKVAA